MTRLPRHYGREILSRIIHRVIPLFLFIIALGGGCNFISLKQIEVVSNPDSYNQVLTPEDEIWMEFSLPVLRTAVEDIFMLTADGRPISGDFLWEESRVVFKPVEQLLPVVRYMFVFSGTVETVDGIKTGHDIQIPFYAGNDEEAPALSSYSPINGADAGINDSIELNFSKTMDLQNLRAGFGIDPHREVVVTLDAGGTIAAITPAGAWVPHTFYTWSLDMTVVTAHDGTPLPIDYEGTFITQADGKPPEFKRFTPAFLSGSTYLDSNVLSKDDSLKFIFSEEVDITSFTTSLSISPTIRGFANQILPGIVIFKPEQEYTMDTEYFVIIGDELTDTSGNNLRETVRFSFTPDIPIQEVTQIDFLGDGPTIVFLPDRFGTDPDGTDIIDLHDIDLTAMVTINFSEPYEEPYRTAVTSRITFHAFFPRDVSRLTNPVLDNAVWVTDRQLTLFYSGLKKSPAANESFYYLLTIPGGKSMSRNLAGSYLREDVWFIVEAEA